MCMCRAVQPALTPEDPAFPHLDFVVISHNHYDHLDAGEPHSVLEYRKHIFSMYRIHSRRSRVHASGAARVVQGCTLLAPTSKR
jgi:L-ascorbate metabolism protein UlaG (beta-lactamase superfamily)